jgi:hypothetical protein
VDWGIARFFYLNKNKIEFQLKIQHFKSYDIIFQDIPDEDNKLWLKRWNQLKFLELRSHQKGQIFENSLQTFSNKSLHLLTFNRTLHQCITLFKELVFEALLESHARQETTHYLTLLYFSHDMSNKFSENR